MTPPALSHRNPLDHRRSMVSTLGGRAGGINTVTDKCLAICTCVTASKLGETRHSGNQANTEVRTPYYRPRTRFPILRNLRTEGYPKARFRAFPHVWNPTLNVMMLVNWLVAVLSWVSLLAAAGSGAGGLSQPRRTAAGQPAAASPTGSYSAGGGGSGGGS